MILKITPAKAASHRKFNYKETIPVIFTPYQIDCFLYNNKIYWGGKFIDPKVLKNLWL